MKKITILLLLSLCSLMVFGQDKFIIKNDSLQKPIVLNEVIVEATRASEKAPFAITNFKKEAIEARNLGQDIPVLVGYLPNVVTTTDAGAGVGYTGIRVRGSDATRVNVTINGIPLNDSESHGTYWVDLPDFASNTQSIQLQRGVGTSTNGAGAFGASLNLLTDGIDEKAGAEINKSYGSFNTHKYTIKTTTGIVNDHFEFSGRLSQIQSDGYIDRAKSDLNSYYVSGTYFNNKTMIKAIGFGGHEITYQAWNGVDAETYKTNRKFNSAGAIYDANWNVLDYYDNEVDNYTQKHYQLHVNHFFNDHLSGNLALHYTQGFGFYEQYKQNQKFSSYRLTPITINGTTINRTDLIRRKWLDNDFYGTTFSLKYNQDALNMIIGGAWNLYDGDHFGEVIWARNASNSEIRHQYYFNNGKKKDFNIFAKSSYQLNEKLNLFGDLQVRNVDYKTYNFLPTDVDENLTFFNPKFGVTYQLNQQNNFYLSYAKAHKEPNRTDYEYAIIPPKSEELNDFELGWRYQKDETNFNANIYYMQYTNQLVLTGAIDLNDGSPIRANSGKSYRLGIEIDAVFKLNNQFSLMPNIGISNNKNINFTVEENGTVVNLGDTEISYSPSIVAGNIINYTPTKNTELSLYSKYVGKQFLSNTELIASQLPDYFVSDLMVKYKFNTSKLFKNIELVGLINNIFDKKYVSNGYMWDTTPYYYPQAGIHFLTGVSIKF
ncbi:MAG: TonB-dependent receptor [Flavobacteriaceae bacterium]|nr:TonB-dependent receptor [Flavobacteriaceae bacterium]